MPKPVGSSQRYMPGLDGLRAIAVLAVIAYHLELGWAPGGLLGVGVFFTLSGYLITDLLLEQRDAVGHLRLGDFWIRRARRLLPALFLMLAGVVAWVAILDPSQLPVLRGDVFAAVLYVSNWWYIFHNVSYFAHFGPPPPLGHLWSLAVEEQFYVFWPLLLWLGLFFTRGRYRLAGMTLAAAALSAALMAYLYQPASDPTRVYDGTDTRAFGLLVGAALAMVWPSRRFRAADGGGGGAMWLTKVWPSRRLGADHTPMKRRHRRSRLRRRRIFLDVAGVVGLVIIVLLIWRTNQYSAFLYRGGIVVLSVATVLVLAALVHPASWLGRALGWTPLRWLGVRSYGIYLWHYPIIVLTTPTAQRGVNLTLDALQVAATIVVAALSWRFVEEPIRRGALGRFWARVRSGGRRRAVPRRSWVALVGVLSVSVLAGAGLAGVIPSTGAVSSGAPTPSAQAPQEIKLSTHVEVTAPPTTAAPEPSSPEAAPAAAPATRTSCDSVAYIGDSTSQGMIMPSYLPDPVQRLDAKYAQAGATSQFIEISGARSIVETLPGEANGDDVARQLVAEGFQGCWVIALGNNDTANVYMGSQVGLMNRIERMMSIVGDEPVMWVNVKTVLESGPYSEANMELWNGTLEQACARYPNMRIFDWASMANDSWFSSDGTHFTSEGYAQRARLTADSLVHAFPASEEAGRSGCVVH